MGNIFNIFKALSLFSTLKNEFDNAMKDGRITIDEAGSIIIKILPAVLELMGYTKNYVKGIEIYKE